MENHPIPQDVTGFKFKLIGSITVKQFLYLLGFGILTTVSFLVFQKNILLMVPSMTFFTLIGVGLAFVPIEGRPMDTMIVNFAKTIPSENRFIYKKRGANLASFEVFNFTVSTPKPQTQTNQPVQAQRNEANDKKALLLSRLRNSTFRPDEQEVARLRNIRTFFDEGPSFKAPPPPPAARNLDRQIQETEDKEKQERIAQLQKEAEEKQEKDKAEQENLAKIQAEEAKKQAEQSPPIHNIRTVESEEKKIPVSSPSQTVPYKPSPNLAGGFPALPDIPNIVLGIIRDPRGKTLPNILVEVMDANNLPIRAFKTNPLGQFASATPLANGTYKVIFEDPTKQHEFEVREITLDGTIFNPIEITSVDSREKLRRELFDVPASV